ncbi:MAG: hypothetical protein ACRC8S_14220 [Fimbriiglobus sp.]
MPPGRPDYHSHQTHGETNTFSSSFGKVFGAGLASNLLWLMGCGGVSLVGLICVCSGLVPVLLAPKPVLETSQNPQPERRSEATLPTGVKPQGNEGQSANEKSSPKPPPDFREPVNASNVTYKLTEWGWQGKQVQFTITATNHKADRDITEGVTIYSKLIDESGDTYNTETGSYRLLLPYEVPVKFKIVFDGVTPNIRKATLLQIQINSDALKFSNIPLIPDANQLPKPINKPSSAVPSDKGKLTLRSNMALGVGVAAFVEVDGKKIVDWPSGESEVTVDLLPGKYKVVYRSKYKGKYYKFELGDATVTAGEERLISIPNEQPKADPQGKW